MGCVGRNVLRFGLIGLLATGAAVAIAGPHRVVALGSQVRHAVNKQIDEHITDPVAYREQLRALEAEYPDRIAEVERDLAELREQTAELSRQRDHSARVVEVAQRDLAGLTEALAVAERRTGDIDGAMTGIVPASARSSDFDADRVMIRFRGDVLNVDAAYEAATEVTRVRDAYADRVEDLDTHLGYLVEQEARLADLASTLRSEQAQFQDELWQLEREIDSIARNERLIDVLERRQDRIDAFSRYEAASLDQIKGRLGDKRASQDARLASLTSQTSRTSYEQRAKVEIERERRGSSATSRERATPAARTNATTQRVTVIDADSAGDEQADDAEDDHCEAKAPLASRGF